MIYAPPPHTGHNILYQDKYLLVINKPSGLLSVPGRGEEKQDCLISRLQVEYPDALIVHRLDMSTSGLMMIARGKEIERALSILFQKREVKKKYIAIVSGRLKEKQGRIDVPIITDWPNRPKQKVDWLDGKPSITDYSVFSYDSKKNTSTVDLQPVTGRTHQLRLHLKQIGHAILGDELYATMEVIKQSKRLLLHACYLSFKHPVTSEIIELNAKAEFQ
ncbi:MAG: pseudouridine synthase [Woeseiaceae bacterium]